ncbi:MAG TPA: aldehyde dehydrogenase family protein, partial [Solirubrobacteraceae bacterium]|nr:aldehyde dehydrogenase family protein [Solirubrobacteraceae bacterium]
MSAATLPDELAAASREFATGPHGHLIGGERCPSADGRTFTTVDPSTGRPIADVPQGGSEDVDRAVRAARSALDGRWGSMTAPKRAARLYALAELVEGHADELAQLEALDNGKPVRLAKVVDVRLAAEHLRYYAGWPTKIVGQTIPVGQPGMHVYT